MREDEGGEYRKRVGIEGIAILTSFACWTY
jgi:hypothetical protein